MASQEKDTDVDMTDNNNNNDKTTQNANNNANESQINTAPPTTVKDGVDAPSKETESVVLLGGAGDTSGATSNKDAPSGGGTNANAANAANAAAGDAASNGANPNNDNVGGGDGGYATANGNEGDENPDNNDDGMVENDDDDDDDGGDEEGAATNGSNKKGKNKKEGGKGGITRIRYSNDFKVKVLDELTVTNFTVAEMARRHKLPEATLRDWVKTKDKITTAQVNRRGSAKSNSRDNLQKVTDALRTFMDLNDRLGACGMSKLPITNALIAKQGQAVKAILLEKDAKKAFLTPQERKTMNAFNASIWWSKKWARKHNLHSVGHREAAKAAAAMSSRVPEIRKEYSRDHVFFVVDTMLFYKVLPTRSYVVNDKGGTPAPGPQGQAKRTYLDTLEARVSVFISANSSGTHKIPLALVSDDNDPPSFLAKRQKVFPCMYQENAWANPKMLLSWWKDVFLPHIRGWTDEKVLLVLQKPSIVDLEDPQQQVTVRFLPPMLANNHNNTVDGLSVSSFFEPPVNMLSVVKTKYRYELLREVLQIYDERDIRREVSDKAGLATPGLKQGYLPHLQDCMRILNTVWTELPSSAISSAEEDGGKRKKRRKRRKLKGTTENDIIENEAMFFSDELGTDELIKEIIHFFRKHSDGVEPGLSARANSLDKAVAEVKSCFLNEQLHLKSNQTQLRKILQNWVALEDAQDIRAMLQTEIMSGMKFRLIIGVDDMDNEQQGDDLSGALVDGGGKPAAKVIVEEPPVKDEVALECATQLLECAVRLSKENPVFHDLASKLIEASDSAFVALREAKLPPEERAMNKKETPPPKKRKQRTVLNPRKKRAKTTTPDNLDNAEEGEKENTTNNKPMETQKIVAQEGEEKAAPNPELEANTDVGEDEYEGAVFQI